jgi:hypothetical protein
MIKVVIFVDHEEDSCSDERWKRFQYLLCDRSYKDLKKAILEVAKKYGDC